MDEFQFIHAIKQKAYRQANVKKGVGDDAAIFKSYMDDAVTAVDTFVENVHFSLQTMSPFQIGYRALAANISDIAAMGGMPKLYLASIIIPPYMEDKDLKAIFSGMDSLAKAYGIDLIGGDTVSGKELIISVTIFGTVAQNKARYRHDAKDGDIVFVTGYLGSSAAGLHLLLHDEPEVAKRDYLIRKHQMPSPRVAFINALQHIDRIALNDISDGIANELRELAEASQVTITVEDALIPIHEDLQQFTEDKQYAWKYFGGEDFELVGTVAEKDWPAVRAQAEKLSLSITKIGYVEATHHSLGQVFVHENDTIKPLKKLGYIHLK